jgi:hypothetical protein
VKLIQGLFEAQRAYKNLGETNFRPVRSPTGLQNLCLQKKKKKERKSQFLRKRRKIEKAKGENTIDRVIN